MIDGFPQRSDPARGSDSTRTVRRPDGGRDLSDPADRLEAIADVLDHDIPNYLTVANGYLDQAREAGDEEALEQVQGALDRIEGLVDEVVYLARTGDLVDETAPVELRSVVGAAWAAVPIREAQLVVEETATVLANWQALQHLLENVVQNAVVHAGPAVTVRVGTTADGFYVADDGPGIPADRRERVFESGRRYGPDGTGLGLTIADRIAAAHGWTMRVEEGVAGGARFVVEGVSTA